MESNPRVTLLIANNNYSSYLKGCLLSAITQTYPYLQICVIDDGSSDNSFEIIFEQLFKNKPFRKSIQQHIEIYQYVEGTRKYVCIKVPNSVGPSEARNYGIKLTLDETEHYVILDADDEAHPTKVERFTQILQAIPMVGIVYADYDILNVNTGNIIREYKEPYSKRRLLQECIVHSGFGIRKQALLDTVEETGFYDRTMRTCEDWDLELRVSDKYMIYHIPESLTLVRNHNQNSTYSVKNEIWQANWQRIHYKFQMRNQ